MQLAKEYRRKAAACGGGCAALAAIPAVGSLHGHLALAFTCIGLQLVLLVMAARFLMQARQARSSN